MDDKVAALSRSLLSTLTSSVFGDIAGPLASSELGELLGLGGSNEVGEYLDKIEAQLTQMQSELVQLQATVNVILAGETAIEEKIADVELQQALENFTIAATTIREAFSTYTDIVGGLASADAATQKEAATELYELLSLRNTQALASAMTVVQEFFAPSLSEMKGLIEYQNDVLTGAALDYAKDSNNLIGAPPKYLQFPIPGCTYWQSQNILVKGREAAANAADSVVMPTLAAFATVQAQGLTLLNTAWLKTIHESQIGSQAKAIQRVLDTMVNWGPAVPPVVDAGIATNLQLYGKRVNDPWTNGLRWDFGDGDVTYDNRFAQDWLMWSFYGESDPLIAQAPWNLGAIPLLGLLYAPSPPYAITSMGINRRMGVFNAGTFSLPPKITAFLSALKSQSPTAEPEGV